MAVEKKWLFTLCSASFISLFLYFSAIAGFSASSALFSRTPSFYGPSAVRHGASYPPAFAYFIFGSRGHKHRVLRLLFAVYHPRNRYLLHLGTEASDREREELAVVAVPAVEAFENVDVVREVGCAHLQWIFNACCDAPCCGGDAEAGWGLELVCYSQRHGLSAAYAGWKLSLPTLPSCLKTKILLHWLGSNFRRIFDL